MIFNPDNSGHIECNRRESPTKQYTYIDVGTQCAAEPNKGFLFSSWTENLGHKSTKTISTSVISSDSPYNSFLSVFGLFHPDDTAAKLKIAHYGNFTANYKQISPPVPPEYWIPLYGIIVSTIVGWSIASIIGWIKAKRQGRQLHYYHKRINSLYDDGKLDESDIEPLNKIK